MKVMMDLIVSLRKIAFKLPEPIKGILRKPWRLWLDSVKWDNEMLGLIADYFKISKKEVKFLLKLGRRLDAFYWQYLKLNNSEDTFYKTTPFYIFDLAFWNMMRDKRIFHSKIVELSHGKVLDFGGGVGVLSLNITRKGLSVDYADVEGETLKFAKQLFLRNNLLIKVINLSKEKVTDKYDTIICLDVIEHLENQKETLNLFINNLNPDGTLIITNLDFNEMDQEQYKNHPMHIPLNFDAKKYLLDNGLVETKYPWAFIKKPK